MWGGCLAHDLPLSGNDLEQTGGLPKSHMCYKSLLSLVTAVWILDPN